jgi:hypothetical protein
MILYSDQILQIKQLPNQPAAGPSQPAQSTNSGQNQNQFSMWKFYSFESLYSNLSNYEQTIKPDLYLNIDQNENTQIDQSTQRSDLNIDLDDSSSINQHISHTDSGYENDSEDEDESDQSESKQWNLFVVPSIFLNDQFIISIVHYTNILSESQFYIAHIWKKSSSKLFCSFVLNTNEQPHCDLDAPIQSAQPRHDHHILEQQQSICTCPVSLPSASICCT